MANGCFSSLVLTALQPSPNGNRTNLFLRYNWGLPIAVVRLGFLLLHLASEKLEAMEVAAAEGKYCGNSVGPPVI